MKQKFDPHETIPMSSSRGAPVWVFLVFAFVVSVAAVGYVAWRESEREAKPAPAPVAAPRAEPEPSPPVPEWMKPSVYAVQLAAAQTNYVHPPEYLVREFDELLDRAGSLYPRSTDLQIRDAVYTVASLKVYNRPDIDILKAARLIVDWTPGEGMPVPQAEVDVEAVPVSGGMSHAGRSVSFNDLPVSRAVDDISQTVVSDYNDWVAAQWQAEYERKAAIQQRRWAVFEEHAARRAAQEQARREAAAAQAQQQMEFQRFLAQHSIAGTLYRRR